MSSLLASRAAEASNSSSPIGFETTPGGAWPKWHRYLTVDGKRAYELGNICNTCAFFFERMEGANSPVDVGELASKLEAGIEALSDDITDRVVEMMPDGRYEALLLRSHIHPVYLGEPGDYFVDEQRQNWGEDGFWGLPHWPKVPYYRAGSRRISDVSRLFEFVIPMFPRGWLDQQRLSHYRSILAQGSEPTAVAVSVLDVKAPADRGEIHWCLAHYVLDGHHKIEAAALTRQPITLISLLATNQGVSSAAELAEVVDQLRRGDVG